MAKAKEETTETAIAITGIYLQPSREGGQVYVQLADGRILRAITTDRHSVAARLAKAEDSANWEDVTSVAGSLFQ